MQWNKYEHFHWQFKSSQSKQCDTASISHLDTDNPLDPMNWVIIGLNNALKHIRSEHSIQKQHKWTTTKKKKTALMETL